MQFHEISEIHSSWLQNCGDVTARVACCVFPFFSSISSPGMMNLQNEVVVAFPQSDHSSASAPRRFNLREDQLQPLGRKHLRRGDVGQIQWRCCAGELLWSCWGRLRMFVIAAPRYAFGVWNETCGVLEICGFEMFGVFAIQSRWSRHS